MPASTCPLCGLPADTQEHIIPRWIQKEYQLETQPLGLHNGTLIKYNQARIPLCIKCNGIKLSGLEEKVKDGLASPQEYFLWALKIRYFLTLKDTTLLLDRADPTKGPLVDGEVSKMGIEFIRNALLNCDNPDYNYFPYPFGSVFLLENTAATDFGLLDLPNPYWGLCITIPKNRLLAVLFSDRCLVKASMVQSYGSETKLQSYLEGFCTDSTMEGIKALMFVLCLRQHRITNIPRMFHLYENGIKSDLPDCIQYREPDKTFVLMMAARFRLPNILVDKIIRSLN